MKINTEINTRVQGYPAKKAEQAEQATSQTGNTVQSQQSSQRGSIRDMSNALMVMQKAQEIVQRALTASHRLQNMAMGTITNNSAAYEQIGQELRSVNASLGEYSVPVAAPPAAQEVASREIPQLKDNVQALENIALNQAQGQNQSLQLDQVSQNLRSQALRIEEGGVQIMGHVNKNEMPFDQAVKQTADLISANTSSALSAQGYVKPEQVSRLI